MPTCPHYESCGLLRQTLADLPRVSEIYVRQYCDGHSEVCARLRVLEAAGRENVPPSLYPYQHGRADFLIRAARS